MLYTKIQWSRPDFYHIWTWRLSWSCDQDHLNKLSSCHPIEAPYEIWLQLAQYEMFKECRWGRRPTNTINSPMSLRLRWAKNPNKMRRSKQYIFGKIMTALTFGQRQANLVLIAYASSEGSGEPAHPRSLARTSAARSYRQWVKRNRQTESQIPGPSEWLGMLS